MVMDIYLYLQNPSQFPTVVRDRLIITNLFLAKYADSFLHVSCGSMSVWFASNRWIGQSKLSQAPGIARKPMLIDAETHVFNSISITSPGVNGYSMCLRFRGWGFLVPRYLGLDPGMLGCRVIMKRDQTNGFCLLPLYDPVIGLPRILDVAWARCLIGWTSRLRWSWPKSEVIDSEVSNTIMIRKWNAC